MELSVTMGIHKRSVKSYTRKWPSPCEGVGIYAMSLCYWTACTVIPCTNLYACVWFGVGNCPICGPYMKSGKQVVS